MIKILLLFMSICLNLMAIGQIYLPVYTSDRSDISLIELTDIGTFGEIRKARPKVPEHLHTGIDIKRPYNNYIDEPIFPVAEGRVISLRDDGPYAQIIIRHDMDGIAFWSVYEHIADIRCQLNESVTPDMPIARFMNTNELNRYGWQFDHVHLELMKVAPQPIQPNSKTPSRYYTTYWLSCFNTTDLNEYYYDPFNIFMLGFKANIDDN